jgi:hypothetical protein
MVSPVAALRSPTAAQMSPAYTSEISSRLLACIFSSRPSRSDLPVAAFTTLEPVATLPE